MLFWYFSLEQCSLWLGHVMFLVGFYLWRAQIKFVLLTLWGFVKLYAVYVLWFNFDTHCKWIYIHNWIKAKICQITNFYTPIWKTVVLCHGNVHPFLCPSVRGFQTLFQDAVRYQFETWYIFLIHRHSRHKTLISMSSASYWTNYGVWIHGFFAVILHFPQNYLLIMS